MLYGKENGVDLVVRFGSKGEVENQLLALDGDEKQIINNNEIGVCGKGIGQSILFQEFRKMD